MSVLYVTEPDEETGMVAAITDEPCACGWPETVLHIMTDGTVTRGCPSCEVEHPEPIVPDSALTESTTDRAGSTGTEDHENGSEA